MNKGYSLREMIVSTLESEKDKNFTSREITLQRISASVTNSLSSISFPNATLFTAKPKLSRKYVSDK